MSLFTPAKKTGSKIRLLIGGTAGAGKTYSALAVATSLGSKVALLDTEHGSASKYADIFSFDSYCLKAPYTPEKYIKAIKTASREGYDVLIVDSLSHAWKGSGGILEIVDEGNSRSANSGWKNATPRADRLTDAILSAPIHIIATSRAKTEYSYEKNEKGKIEPRRLGLGFVLRPDSEYDFDVVMMLDDALQGAILKSRCSAISNKSFFKPGAELASILLEWLGDAVATTTDSTTTTATATDSIDDRVVEKPAKKKSKSKPKPKAKAKSKPKVDPPKKERKRVSGGAPEQTPRQKDEARINHAFFSLGHRAEDLEREIKAFADGAIELPYDLRGRIDKKLLSDDFIKHFATYYESLSVKPGESKKKGAKKYG